MQRGGETSRCLADNGLEVVASLVGGHGRAALFACLLEDRSSRPHCSPRLLPVGGAARICATRRRSGWGPRLIAGETGHAHATVWRALKRAGISRLPREPREQSRRYERPRPRRSGRHRHPALRSFQPFQVMPSPAIVSVPAPRSGPGRETSSCTRSSTTSRLVYSELHRDERQPASRVRMKRSILLCQVLSAGVASAQA